MKKIFPAIVLFCLALPNANAQNTDWGVKFSDAIISRYQPTINNMTNKGWEYSNSIILHGMERIYEKTENTAYLNYIKTYIDSYIGSDGTGVSSHLAQNLDVIHPGLLCLFLYKQTGELKYKTAADLIRKYIDTYPRNASGGFWHKSNYPNQMWLDGLYMAEPFLAKYGFRMNDAEYCNNETTFQALLINSHAWDPNKKLLYHGWDETKAASWANPTTGVSPEIWSRAMGWYAMALTDILKYLPDDHPMFDSVQHVLGRVAEGLKMWQDPSTGLWFQVMDKGNLNDDWTETSGSGMFVYALKTAVNYGWIDTSYLSTVRKGWAGLQTKISTYTDGKPEIDDFAAAMGIKNTYADYVSQSLITDCPKASGTQHPHGYCAILMASSAMEYSVPKQFRLQVKTDSHGTVSTSTGELYQDSASVVTITAHPATGYEFSNWSGDASGTDPALQVTMNGHKHITANFKVATVSNYILNINISGSGTVDPQSGNSYAGGTTVNLTATPAEGFKFDSWSGDITGTSNTILITMDGSKTVTANFVQNLPSAIQNKTTPKDFVCYPAATTNSFTLMLTLAKNTIFSTEIVSSNGSVVYSNPHMEGLKGQNKFSMSLGKYQRGVYLCRVSYNNVQLIQKLHKI